VKTKDQAAESEATRRGNAGFRSIIRWPYLPWVVAGVAVGLAILFAILWQSAESPNRRRIQVAGSAREFLLALTNFSGETIDQDAEEISSFAVGDFADQVRTFFNQRARQALRKAKATSQGRVQKVFVESLSGDTASVFGVVSESVTNSATQTPRAEVLRIEMDMIETKDGWKVNRVNILQSPGSGPFGNP
jgi:hypothetical protein